MNTNTEPLINLTNVTFSYRGYEEKALRDVNAAFFPGKCYTIEGPNGCGKSTLFRILLGLDFPDEGEYIFDGMPITARKMKNEAFARNFHKRIGFVFQDSEVQLFTQSVRDEIAFGLYQLHLPEDEIREKTDEFLKLFDLEALAERAPFTLSGGQKRRVAFAAVFAMDPEVVVIDEPLSGLDEKGQAFITQFLKGLKGGKHLIIVSTHNRALADEIADVHVHMAEGRIVDFEGEN
ncbi:MAG: energy-coupling factor ABC transporter ATP-binding protein [Lachnospiraceae bacterium]|nr:energy-coupling factor ABC transporter ATP-binding protein [Lachnospiraceae bacterium]MCH4030195.1 energy-coupling factor ABC transporter ATP-binding protein [Lachnospiraceae bacterium]MCH4069407.1 energy-coupling factor ABC transporter ATP-binding protein [Lachnospiraceae bacterium]MCH4107657.1 energy-coupling factor ABC transporter ATP-binding protein [Lachnospiraceae bacterium]MCI1301492.1 energy-coupling factor ABC transporter ATP-binding protein [Lachnospiraceae bacterium]